MDPEKTNQASPEKTLQTAPGTNQPGHSPRLSNIQQDVFEKVIVWRLYNAIKAATNEPSESDPSSATELPMGGPQQFAMNQQLESTPGIQTSSGFAGSSTTSPNIAQIPLNDTTQDGRISSEAEARRAHSHLTDTNTGMDPINLTVNQIPTPNIVVEDAGESSGHINETQSPASISETPVKESRNSTTGNFSIFRTLSGHSRSVSVVRFSPCGIYLGTGSADQQIKIWRVLGLECILTLAGHTLGINDFSWNSNSQYIASASDDKTVKLYSLESGACIKTLFGHGSHALCCCFNPQSSIIASGGSDGTICLWDVETGTSTKRIPAHLNQINSIVFNYKGTVLATSSHDGFIRIWNAFNGECQRIFADTNHAPVSCLFFSPNGRYLFSSHLDSKILLWDFKKGNQIKTYQGHENSQYCVYANMSIPLGQLIVSGSEDGKIYLWNLQTAEIKQILEGHTTPVLAVDCHPRCNLFASAGLEPDNSIRIWKQDQ